MRISNARKMQSICESRCQVWEIDGNIGTNPSAPLIRTHQMIISRHLPVQCGVHGVG